MTTTEEENDKKVIMAKDSQPENALNYIGTKKTVTEIFSLPYYTDKAVSVGIHNIEGCLIIDDPTLTENFACNPSNIQEDLERQKIGDARQDEAEKDGENSVVSIQQTATLSAISSMIEEGRREIKNAPHESKNAGKTDSQLLHEGNQVLNLFSKNSSEPREYLPWEFSGMKMLIGSDALVYRSTPDASITVRVEDAAEMRRQLQFHQKMLTKEQDEKVKRSYAEALRSQTLLSKAEQQSSSRIEHESAKQKNDNKLIPSIADSKLDSPRQTAISTFSADDFDGIKLHTSIVPTTHLPLGANFSVVSEPPADSDKLSSPIYTVVDAYLDQLITNVPQLALVLQEKGFVQSVKLLETEYIPEAFMKQRTWDTTHAFEVIGGDGDVNGAKASTAKSTNSERIFDPNIMEIQAGSLLNFIRSNCNKDNATYLLHKEAGKTNIQLFDVTAISNQRQRKWIWWLAMMSYRFAQRLRHLSLHMMVDASGRPENAALRRSFRTRERSLLENTLSLLEDFTDMGGQPHDTLVAEVCAKLAETFLRADEGAGKGSFEEESPSSVGSPATCTANLQQRYKNAKPDALNKAQDYLGKGVLVLWRVWKELLDEVSCTSSKDTPKSREEQRNQAFSSQDQNEANSKECNRVVSINGDSSSSDEEDEEHKDVGDNTEASENEALQVKAETIATQLLSLQGKQIDIFLRLAQHHLQAYFSSSAMQSLRTAARKMADSVAICLALRRTFDTVAKSVDRNNTKLVEQWIRALQLQYTRLWELCGHFARSFASDDLWRDRGHAAGDDVVAVLRDVESAFPVKRCQPAASQNPDCFDSYLDLSFVEHIFCPYAEELFQHVGDLYELTGIQDRESSCSQEEITAAKNLLETRHQLQRDRRRVLVAASACYERAIAAFEASIRFQCKEGQKEAPSGGEQIPENYQGSNDLLRLLNLLRQRLGDANNELGKLFLDELRSSLSTEGKSKNEINENIAAGPLLSSALHWFTEGLQAFDTCKDLRNSSLLRCNICQCYKLKANANFASQGKVRQRSGAGITQRSKHADTCLKDAIFHLQSAHETIGQREVDKVTWDMVSNELAATLLVLGVRRRQALLGGGNTPVVLHAMRLTPGETRSIIEPMEKALVIYEESGNAHQAAAVHYQLALFYSKIWTCQRDEAKTREMLSAAFRHYNKAHSYFFGAIQGNEPTFVLICLDLSNLYSTVSGEECLCQALLRCLDTMGAFSKESIDSHNSDPNQEDWLSTMATLATSVEDRLFKLLKSLVKVEPEKDISYKDIYRAALSAKMSTSGTVNCGEDQKRKNLGDVYEILQAAKEQCKSLLST